MFHVKHLLVTLALLTLPPSSASAQRLYTAGGAEVWSSTDPYGHGYILLTYQVDKIFQEAMLDVTYNTDTLWIAFDNLKLDDALSMGAMLKGQTPFAGLLPDYYVQGVRDRERGFFASYVQGRLWAKVLDNPHFFEMELGARRWFFSETPQTADAFTLPQVRWSVEPRLRYTLWKLEGDPAIFEPHRHTWRLRGIALGAELGLDLRDQYGAWGAIDPDAFTQIDQRNHPRQAPLYAVAWLRGGVHLTDSLRAQTAQVLMVGSDMDDLNRWRLGGLNPYVVPLGAHPWAAYVSSSFIASEISLMWNLLADHEIGLATQSIFMSSEEAARSGDGQRLGLDASIHALSLIGDWRWGDWQLDTKLGFGLPSRHLQDKTFLSAWLSLGYRIF
jgi:hypothetical protein